LGVGSAKSAAEKSSKVSKISSEVTDFFSEMTSDATEELASELPVCSSSTVVQSQSVREGVSDPERVAVSFETATTATSLVSASPESAAANSTQSSLLKEELTSSKTADGDQVDGGSELAGETANSKSVNISPDSVSSALSVLLKTTPTSFASSALPGSDVGLF